MGLEITAAHLLRAVYGTSNIVWACVIGLILLFLTLGYRLGGTLADRHPQERIFFRLLAWAGFTAGAAILLARLLLRPAAAAMANMSLGPIAGSFIGAMALLAAPTTLLGCISPFALRLALNQSSGSDGAGDAAGQVYGASALGSFLGTFLPPLLLIPLLGARVSFWTLAAVLLLASLALYLTQKSLIMAVFTVGLVSLGTELAVNRLLGPSFGDSNLVWAAVIGVNMAGLAVGYFAGGRLADWTPDRRALAGLLAVASLTVGLAPWLSGPALSVANSLPPTTSLVLPATVATAILLGLPVALMGCASPFAVRLLLPKSPTAGGEAGTLYAISTAGSLAGAYLPVLWLIPKMGAAASMLVMAIPLLFIAIIRLLPGSTRREKLLILLPLVLLLAAPLSRGSIKDTPGQLYEAESAYNYIEVVEREGVRYLLLNEGQGVHSMYRTDGKLTHGTWDFFLAAPFFNPAPYRPSEVGSLAVVGLAAGTISKQYSQVFGPIPIDGIEIDPAIVKAARSYFDMNEPNLNVIVGDGRRELDLIERQYDVVGIDAYRLPYIPWHLTTREFFQEIRQHLTGKGVVAINVGRTPGDRSLVEAFTATMLEVYPSVHVMDVPDTFNTILVATVQPTSAGNLDSNLPFINDPMLKQAVEGAIRAIQQTVPSRTIFTDDLAPIELMTNQIIIDYILSGGVETLAGPME